MYWIFEKIKESFFEERERWFLWIPVLFGLGIGIYFMLPTEPSLWISLIAAELLIITTFIYRFHKSLLFIISIIAIILSGFINIQLKAHYLANKMTLKEAKTDYLNGKIVNIDKNYRGMERITLQNPQNFEQYVYEGNYRISLRTNESQLQIGDCVELVGRIMPVPPTSIVGGYQFDRKFFFDGITANGYAVSSINKIECNKKENNYINNYINKLRQSIVNRIKTILPPDESGITAAIIAGKRDGISKIITHNYRDAGLAHFLSISGLHMTMLAGLMFFFIRLIIALIPPIALRYDSKKISAIAAMLLSTFYLLISGAEIPTQRAFIMTMIVLIGVLVGRRAISINTICWAALFILIVSPQALIGASFQMSFAAVMMLVAFYEKYAIQLNRFLNGGDKLTIGLFNRIWRIIWVYMIGLVISDMVASLATLPFGIYHFNRISIYTTLGNFLAGPIIGLIIMPFVLLSLLLMPLGMDVFTIKIVGYGISLVNKITAEVAALPQAGYQTLSIPLWGMLLIVFGGLWLAIWQLPWRKLGWLGIILGCLSIFTIQIPQAIISSDGLLLAVKDNHGRLLFLPRRGKIFNKQIWLEKTANKTLKQSDKQKLKEIWDGETEYPEWIDLKCTKLFCDYAGKFRYYKNGKLEINGIAFDTQTSGGASFYNNGKVKTVRDYTGNRIWNKF